MPLGAHSIIQGQNLDSTFSHMNLNFEIKKKEQQDKVSLLGKITLCICNATIPRIRKRYSDVHMQGDNTLTYGAKPQYRE